MKSQQSRKYLNESYILSLHYAVNCARKDQDKAIDAFILGKLSEQKAIEAVNYLESMEHCFVRAGGSYKDLYQ